MFRSHYLSCAVAAGVLMCANALAQDKPSKSSSEVKQETKATTKSGTKKTNTDTVFGKVESFEPGKSIKVSVPGTLITSKSFDLSGKEITANVPSSIKVGDWVRVRETDESNGHKIVAVSHSTESAANKASK